DHETFFGIVDSLRQGDVAACLVTFDDILRKGFDGSSFVSGLAGHLRNLAVCKDTKTEILFDVGAAFTEKYQQQAAALSFAFILNALNLVNDCDEKYKTSRNPRLLVELCLMKLAHLNSYLLGIGDIEELKKKFLK
ncbi:MAG: DNA polymerase III subunit gamma/tau, partial [Bacteroidia bacterium]|nr:DNA polymerase III subunit gamma/tau [Bacteroidia bacterium]